MKDQDSYGQMIGTSANMVALLEYVRKVAHHDVAVLVTGETGVGKELIANAIHELSPRRHHPLVVVNCAAIPEGLIDSELFGHERGAFTGALQTRKGKFELADGGTLFLDEIGDMSPVTQAKLLRVLQQGEYYRVGGQNRRYADVRVVSATNKNLESPVERVEFRRDLFYRICEDRVEVPPLRKRPEDIPILLDHFLKTLSSGKHSGLSMVSEDALTLLQAYAWPGNVRELQGCVRKLLCHHAYHVIQSHHMSTEIIRSAQAGISDPFKQNLEQVIQSASLQTLHTGFIQNIERSLIVEVLNRTDGRKKTAAKIIHMSLNTLKSKMKRYNITIPDSTGYAKRINGLPPSVSRFKDMPKLHDPIDYPSRPSLDFASVIHPLEQF